TSLKQLTALGLADNKVAETLIMQFLYQCVSLAAGFHSSAEHKPKLGDVYRGRRRPGADSDKIKWEDVNHGHYKQDCAHHRSDRTPGRSRHPPHATQRMEVAGADSQSRQRHCSGLDTSRH